MKPVKFFTFLIVVFLIGFGFLAPASAYAYQLATATFIPPSVTPTSQSFGCPVGTPAGWGIYTPSPLWDLTCGNCSVIVTPSPTVGVPCVNPTSPDPYNTPYAPSIEGGTPVLLGSPVPNVCGVTGTPAPTVTATAGTPAPTATVGFLQSFYFEYVNGGTNVNSYVCNETSYGAHCDFSTTWTSGGGSAILFRVITSSPFYWDIHFSRLVDLSLRPYNMQYVDHLSGSPSEYAWFGMYGYNIGSAGLITGYFDISPVNGGWVQPATETPTPSPTPFLDTGYCSSIAPVIDEFGFDLFVDDGEPNCNMGWNEFSVGSYDVPAVQICLQPSQFGVIRMFGNDYEVGVYGLAAAAAFLWRFMRTV